MKKRWLVVVLCLGAIGCFFYNFCLPKICLHKTEPAECMFVEEIIKTDGFLVFDETVIDVNKGAGAVYRLNDGEKVSKGGIIADIYENTNDADIEKQIEDIDEDIKLMESISKTEACDVRKPDVIDSEINKTIIEMQVSLTKSNYQDVFQRRNELLKLMSEKKMSNGKKEDFTTKIDNLAEEKKSLEASISGKKQSFLSPFAGYFVSFSDGYENSISYNDIKKSNFKNFDAENLKVNKKDKCLGKIITSGDWYMVCKISEDEKQKLKKGMECQIKIPSADNRDMPCTVNDLISLDSGENIAVICCNYISREIFSFRKGEIHLKIGEYYGYKLKKSAVHYKDLEDIEQNPCNLIGVSVKYGNSVMFKRINIIYSEAEFVVVSESDPDEENSDQYIKRGDEIIV